jgi:hypothetical protein
MLGKTYRDLARLYCLRKDKHNALVCHDEALRIFNTDVFPGIQMNIKLAKLALLKGVWLSEFDLEASNETLGTAFTYFE